MHVERPVPTGSTISKARPARPSRRRTSPILTGRLASQVWQSVGARARSAGIEAPRFHMKRFRPTVSSGVPIGGHAEAVPRQPLRQLALRTQDVF